MMTESGRGAVLYARVSTRGQAEEGYSLRQQIEALRAWCEREGYEVLEVVTDAGHSGASLERPGLDRVRDLIAARGVSVAVAQDADRITRDPIHRGFLDGEFERCGTRLLALDDWGDDSHEGELLRYMKGWVSKGERLKMVERSHRGKVRKVREGRLIRGPRPPYGFVYTEDGNGLVVSEPEMGVVRRIFEMLAVEGLTMGEIQRRLNGDGIPSPMAYDPHQENSGLWHTPTIQGLVLNDLYRPLTVDEIAASALVSTTVVANLDSTELYGLWTYGKRHQEIRRERDEDGKPRDRYRTVLKPRQEWQAVPIPLSGPGPSRADVDAARKRISGNRRRPPSTSAGRFWQLSGGIIQCAECGSALSTKARRRPSGKVNSWYTCRQRYNNGSRDCTHTRMYRADVLENSVWLAVWKLLSDPEHLLRQYDQHMQRRRRQMRGNPDREARDLIGRLEKLERRRSGYLDLAADGDISREELRAKLAEVDAQLEAAQKALREAKDRQETIQKLQQNRKMLETAFEQFAPRRGLGLALLGPEDRRQVYQALRLLVVVDKHGDVSISGVFDADITEVMVTSRWAPLSWPSPGEEVVRPPFQGDIRVDNTRRPVPKIPEVTRVVDTPYRSSLSARAWRQS